MQCEEASRRVSEWRELWGVSSGGNRIGWARVVRGRTG